MTVRNTSSRVLAGIVALGIAIIGASVPALGAQAAESGDDDRNASASYFLTARVYNDTDEVLNLDYASSHETWVRKPAATLEPRQFALLSVEGWAGASISVQYSSPAGYPLWMNASNPISTTNTSDARAHDSRYAIDHSIASGWDASASFYVRAASQRELLGGFELRSAQDPQFCADLSEGAPRNGTPIVSSTCHAGKNQEFVHTAEGQLRAANTASGAYCLDIKDAKAFDGANIHTWKCDGGSSEKWDPRIDGSIASKQNPAYCLSMSPSVSEAQLTTRRCSGGPDQKFSLEPR